MQAHSKETESTSVGSSGVPIPWSQCNCLSNSNEPKWHSQFCPVYLVWKTNERVHELIAERKAKGVR